MRANRNSKFALLMLLFFTGFLYSGAYNYIYPYTSPSFTNYGSVGLIQNPTARFHREGTLAFSWSHNDPYLRGSILAYPFNFLEASFQYTDSNNELYSPVAEFSGSQSHKDKSFDVKVMLLKEGYRLPQLAFGFRDIAGTGRFGSEYITLSKFITSNIDFTLGIGWGNLSGNKITNPFQYISNSFDTRTSALGLGGKLNIDDFFSGDAGYFAGIEWFMPRMHGLRVKLELDGTNYITEGFEELAQDSKINFGILYPINNEFSIKFSYVKGNTLNFGFSFAIDTESRAAKVKKNPRLLIDNSEVIKNVTSRSSSNLYKASLLYLSKDQINLQKASIVNDDTLEVVISQSKYRNPVVSSSRTLDILHTIAPDSIKKLKVSEINGGLGMYSVEIPRNKIDMYKNKVAPRLVKHDINIDNFSLLKKNYDYVPFTKYPKSFSSLGPELISQIGGPDGFFFGNFRLSFLNETLLSRNYTISSKIYYSITDNMDDLKLASDSILPHVRTDIVDYLREGRSGISIGRLQFNKFGQPFDNIFYKLSLGLFEKMFGGIGGEVLYRPFNKDFAIGAELWRVRQRDFDQKFDFRDYATSTGHLTFYYREPRSNILFKIKGGRYLAKDSGFTFDASREFLSRVRIGAYFTLTDISTEEFGEGSFDKGFYFWVPLDIFTQKHQKKNFGWGLRPITRDGGQSLIHGYSLWGVTDYSGERLYLDNLGSFYD